MIKGTIKNFFNNHKLFLFLTIILYVIAIIYTYYSDDSGYYQMVQLYNGRSELEATDLSLGFYYSVQMAGDIIMGSINYVIYGSEFICGN